MPPTKVGILGAGFIADVHLESYTRFVPDAQVTAVYSRTKERAEHFGKLEVEAVISGKDRQCCGLRAIPVPISGEEDLRAIVSIDGHLDKQSRGRQIYTEVDRAEQPERECKDGISRGHGFDVGHFDS